MISYSQNFEDVMLERALKHISSGFYIDVGAWHPDIDSVTRHFYDKGWSGVNVEPVQRHFEILVQSRPRDTNLKLALSDKSGTAVLHEVGDLGSGLFSLKAEALVVGNKRGFTAKSYPINTCTLAEICDRYCADREIHFLKIDVEGHEEVVIRGGDGRRYRLWIVLIEASDASTKAPAWDTWNPLLTAANYAFAWFDGLNRFYVRAESSLLL